MIDQLADDHDVFLVAPAWFHDAVYAIHPGRSATRRLPARLAAGAEPGRAGAGRSNQIARLVRLTEAPLAGPRDPERRAVVRRGRAILASDPADYAAYVAAIREEYAQVPEEEFLSGRLAVLTELSEREIFRTTKGRQLAGAAQTNLAAEILALERTSELLWKDQMCDLRARQTTRCFR